MGGSSGEREVSLSSGQAIASALEDKGHEVVRVDLRSNEDWGSVLKAARIDAAFLALHGRLGEDGCVQGLCEVLHIPYTGSGVLASALAMDKVKAKELFRQHNVPTPPYYVITSEDDLADIEEIHGSFGFPVIVKPRGEGSSLGVQKVDRPSELLDAVLQALRMDDTALIERYVEAREVQVGVLDGRVLGAIEVAPKKGIYDYEAKYTPGMTDYYMPARLPPTRYLGVLNLAERAVRALGCTGACRVDLLVTEGENEYVLEVNTLCDAILKSARLYACPRKRDNRESRDSGVELQTAAEPLAKAV
jgi:D-alanine-D-alanine ligase